MTIKVINNNTVRVDNGEEVFNFSINRVTFDSAGTYAIFQDETRNEKILWSTITGQTRYSNFLDFFDGESRTRDLSLEIPKGSINGMSSVNKFGRNPDIDTGTVPEDLVDGGGIYAPPTQDRIHQLASTSADDVGTLISSGTSTGGSATVLIDSGAAFIADGVSIGDTVLNDTAQDHSIVISIDSQTQITIRSSHHDTSFSDLVDYRVVNPSGLGAATIHIRQGAQEDGTELTEFVILNGITNVPTVNAYLRITRVHIHGTGSNDSNVGTITLTADTDATVTAQINPNNGQTLMAFYHIPKGKVGFLTGVYATMNKSGNISGAMADFSIRTRLWGDAADGSILKGFFGMSIEGGQFERKYNPYVKVSQETDIWMRIEGVTDSNTDFSGGFDLIIEDE